MAITNGVLNFSGKLGDFIFYKSNKQNIARKKPETYNLSENSIKSSRDFGEASRNATYIRKAFEPLVQFYANNNFHNRLNKRVVEAFKGIPATHLGRKKFIDANIGLLAGFEFNTSTAFDTLFFRNLHCLIGKDGLVKLTLWAGDLKNVVQPLEGAKEAVLEVMLFNYDLNGDEYELVKFKNLKIDLQKPIFPSRQISRTITCTGDKALIIAIGISFFWDSGRSANKRFFAAKISHAFHLNNGAIVEFPEPEPEKVLSCIEEEEDGDDWELVDDVNC
ncbi:hypothetical protein [Pedobacter aquatilis]|uniref:hypothetical protein n=1 Tax=Pedobacter aquatilis TaxID=351343 RepID=UPI00292FE56F|nr:hypothetical protein [Pedobacter aquatilis]